MAASNFNLLMKGISAGINRVGVLAAAACVYACGAGAVPGTETADFHSTIAQHAAVTTTISEEFTYNLKHPDGLTLLYNGHRASRIEPCGCRGLNLGGIDKEAAMLRTLRAGNPNALFIDTGGIFRENTDSAMRLQTWHMMDAMHHLGVQAVNIGFTDLNQGLAALQDFEKRFSLPFVSANIINAKTRQPVFASHKSFDVPLAAGEKMKVAVVGVTALNRETSRGTGETTPTIAWNTDRPAPPISRGRWMIAETNGMLPSLNPAAGESPHAHHTAHELGGTPATPAPGGSSPALDFAVRGSQLYSHITPIPYRLDDPLQSAIEAGNRLRPDHDYLVLMAFVSYQTALQMAPSLGMYDVIIAADYVEHTEPARPVPDGPLVIGGEYDGKYLGLIEVPVADGKPDQEIPERLPVLQSIKPVAEYTRYIDNFARETAALPVQQAAAQSTEKLYAGATSCRTCHVDAYAQWKTHHHSRAMKALVDKNMHFNPDCLRCHTVAFRMPGGFTDLRVTSNLANVQCEVCHGPGEKHVQEMRAAEALKREGKPVPPMQQAMLMQWDKNFCMQCHDPQNDPSFNFDEDILRVRHKNPAPPREKPTTAALMSMME